MANSEKPSRPKRKKPQKTASEKETEKELKAQQEGLDALQITFYEIESWIEKTVPVLNHMTEELDKVSTYVEKYSKQQPAKEIIHDSSTFLLRETLDAMQWSLTCQSDNSLQLQTNITSVEQLFEALEKMRTMQGSLPDDYGTKLLAPQLQESLSASTFDDCDSVDTSTEYWSAAIGRRPHKPGDESSSEWAKGNEVVESVSPDVLQHIGWVYWDCLHPKPSAEPEALWCQSTDPEKNKACTDSVLAIMFLHIVRHHKSACPNATEIACQYFSRARETITDYFDTPDFTVLEILTNLAMFCTLCKAHSQARVYIDLAFRMLFSLHGSLRPQQDDLVERKKHLKLIMAIYYTDTISSIYSGNPPQLDEKLAETVNFYEMISINNELQLDSSLDPKTLTKETYDIHLLELIKISRRTDRLIRDAQVQHYHHHRGPLPFMWAKRVQEIEIALASWFDRLSLSFRTLSAPTPSSLVKPPSHSRDAATLEDQASGLLMLQYQAQWILLHKTFMSLSTENISSPMTPTSDGANQHSDRSHAICTDAANRVVTIAEMITRQHGWCVCQIFVNCIYQASTIHCRNVLSLFDTTSQSANNMIRRTIDVLASSRANYGGLPEDLTICLHDFLSSHGLEPTLQEGTSLSAEDDLLSAHEAKIELNDTLFNSPEMYQTCLEQPILSQTFNTFADATFLRSPTFDHRTMDTHNSKSTWRHLFSSSNVTMINHPPI